VRVYSKIRAAAAFILILLTLFTGWRIIAGVFLAVFAITLIEKSKIRIKPAFLISILLFYGLLTAVNPANLPRNTLYFSRILLLTFIFILLNQAKFRDSNLEIYTTVVSLFLGKKMAGKIIFIFSRLFRILPEALKEFAGKIKRVRKFTFREIANIIFDFLRWLDAKVEVFHSPERDARQGAGGRIKQ